MPRSRILVALLLFSFVACGKDLVDDVATGDDAGRLDAGDGSIAAGGGAGDADANADAGPPTCKPTGPFASVDAIAGFDEVGEIWTLRPERGDAGLAIAAVDAGPSTYFDLKEGPLAGPFYTVLSTDRAERSPVALDDGLHFYFGQETDGGVAIISVARDSVGQNFGPFAQNVEAMPIESTMQPSEPWSVAGKSILYFTVSPGTAGTRDIFRAEKTNTGWVADAKSALTTDRDEGFAAVTDDERVMYCARNESARRAVYFVTRKSITDAWSTPVVVTDTRVNDAASESVPTWVSPDGCEMIFVSNRNRGVMKPFRVVITPTQ